MYLCAYALTYKISLNYLQTNVHFKKINHSKLLCNRTIPFLTHQQILGIFISSHSHQHQILSVLTSFPNLKHFFEVVHNIFKIFHSKPSPAVSSVLLLWVVVLRPVTIPARLLEMLQFVIVTLKMYFQELMIMAQLY